MLLKSSLKAFVAKNFTKGKEPRVHLKYENQCEIGSSYFEVAHRLARWRKCQ
jgi:hypothetical protein